jgi:hypothetical protein
LALEFIGQALEAAGMCDGVQEPNETVCLGAAYLCKIIIKDLEQAMQGR